MRRGRESKTSGLYIWKFWRKDSPVTRMKTSRLEKGYDSYRPIDAGRTCRSGLLSHVQYAPQFLVPSLKPNTNNSEIIENSLLKLFCEEKQDGRSKKKNGTVDSSAELRGKWTRNYKECTMTPDFQKEETIHCHLEV